jgi:hypothetical protein
MNERINELLKQSRTEYWTQYTPSYDYEKFAELIVQECAEIALTDGQSTGNFEVFNKITKHFGVQ